MEYIGRANALQAHGGPNSGPSMPKPALNIHEIYDQLHVLL
jgi:hypothetical protein